MTQPDARAIIYVVEGPDAGQTQAACLAHCEANGYEVVAVVLGDHDGQAWRDGVQAMMFRGETDVVVMHTRADLPPHRRPRIEFVADRVMHPRRPRQG
jgi:hypothetical protein